MGSLPASFPVQIMHRIMCRVIDRYSMLESVIAILCCRTLLRLAVVLWDSDIPLVVCRSYGLIAYVRLVLREHNGQSACMSTWMSFMFLSVQCNA